MGAALLGRRFLADGAKRVDIDTKLCPGVLIHR